MSIDNLIDGRKRVRWTRAQLRNAMKPVVYIFWNANEEALYVGRGHGGLDRPLSASHHMAHIRQEAEFIDFICCESEQDADKLERKLIRQLKPLHNGHALEYIHNHTIKIQKDAEKIRTAIYADQMKDSFYTK